MKIIACDCHKKIIRSEDEYSLKRIVEVYEYTCPHCNSGLQYRGEVQMDGNIITDEVYLSKLPKIEPVKNTKKEQNGQTEQKEGRRNRREKITREVAIRDNLICEDGMPYIKRDKVTRHNGFWAVRLAIESNDIDLLNRIFLHYEHDIKNGAAKDFTKKMKEYLEKNIGMTF